MAQNRGFFGLLGKDVIDCIVVSGQLELRDIARLRQCSNGLNGLFQPWFGDVAIRHHVMNADCDVLEKIVDVNPMLMFKRSNCVSPGGQLELLSPLEHALRVCDSNMWKMFLRKIQDDSQCVSLFLEQEKGLTNNVSIVEPFFDSCQEFITEAYRYLNNDIDITELNPCWMNLVARQRELPMHMLKELCRNGDTFDWDQAAEFDVTDTEKRPSSCRNFTLRSGIFRALGMLPLVLSAGCGVSLATDYLLVRGRADVCVVRLSDVPRSLLFALVQRLEVDVSALLRLQQVREQDLATQVALLQDAQAVRLSIEDNVTARPGYSTE